MFEICQVRPRKKRPVKRIKQSHSEHSEHWEFYQPMRRNENFDWYFDAYDDPFFAEEQDRSSTKWIAKSFTNEWLATDGTRFRLTGTRKFKPAAQSSEFFLCDDTHVLVLRVPNAAARPKTNLK